MLMDDLGQVSSSERQPSLHQAVCDFLYNTRNHCCVNHLNPRFHVQTAQRYQPKSDAKMTKRFGLRSSCWATSCIRYWLVVRLLPLRLSLRVCELK